MKSTLNQIRVEKHFKTKLVCKIDDERIVYDQLHIVYISFQPNIVMYY